MKISFIRSIRNGWLVEKFRSKEQRSSGTSDVNAAARSVPPERRRKHHSFAYPRYAPAGALNNCWIDNANPCYASSLYNVWINVV